jgi:NADH dehydrogenase/NADH:ubiquinone oxidoreductase subunit G
MRKFQTLAVICTFAFASLATGQPGSKHLNAEAEVVELMLLRQKSVREELKIDATAAKKIFEFTYKQQQAAQETFKLPKDQQKAKWETMIKENDDFISANLNSQQRKRLDQIAMHCAGLLMVTKPSIAAELKLTKEQKQQAIKLQRENHEKIHEVISAKSGEGRNDKLAELRKSSDEQLHRLLTADQQKKWQEMAGPAFNGKLLFEEVEKGK